MKFKAYLCDPYVNTINIEFTIIFINRFKIILILWQKKKI